MAGYKPLEFPYFAPEDQLPALLPKFEKMYQEAKKIFVADCILDYISPEDKKKSYYENHGPYFGHSSRYTITGDIDEHYAFKIGRGVSVCEAETMMFVKENTNIPVPTVYAAYERKRKGIKFGVIVMENIGQANPVSHSLHSKIIYRPEINNEMQEQIATKLQGYLDELARIPAPGYFGPLGRRPFRDVPDGPGDPKYHSMGPFDTVEEANEFVFRYHTSTMAKKLDFHNSEDLCESFASLFEPALAKFVQEDDDKPVFTHGEFMAENVIIADDGTIYLVNWQSAGFFPRSFEYVMMDSWLVRPLGKHMRPERGEHDHVWDTMRARFTVKPDTYVSKLACLWRIHYEEMRRCDEDWYRSLNKDGKLPNEDEDSSDDTGYKDWENGLVGMKAGVPTWIRSLEQKALEQQRAPPSPETSPIDIDDSKSFRFIVSQSEIWW